MCGLQWDATAVSYEANGERSVSTDFVAANAGTRTSLTSGLPSIQEIIDNRRLAVFGHDVRLDARMQAHQVLKLSAATRSCRQPDARWSRAPGRPQNSWVQRIGDGTPLSLRRQWKRAVVRGHSVSSLRGSAAYALR